MKAARDAFHVCGDLQTKMCEMLLQSTEKRIDRNPYKQLLAYKLSIVEACLSQAQFQLLFIIHRRINHCLSDVLLSDNFVDDALALANLYNYCVGCCKFDNRFGRKSRVGAGDAQVCSNSFSTILLPQPRIDVKYILQAFYMTTTCFGFSVLILGNFQAISKYRSEHCCMTLISCLLATCKMDSSSTANSESDTSSIEILKALTSHMTAASVSCIADKSQVNDPTMSFFDRMASVKLSEPTSQLSCSSTTANIANERIPPKPDPPNADYLERLVSNEENYYAHILVKCLKICPSVFGKLSNTKFCG